MTRIEIISNKSVEEDITETLENYVPGILYTTIPLAYGRGKNDRKLGTSTWPEKNFIMISYVEDDQVEKIKLVVEGIKEKFPEEGIKLFCIRSE